MLTDAAIERTGDDCIRVELTGKYGWVKGWPEAREDLGFNRGGPDPVPGVEAESEVQHERGSGYDRVVLVFGSFDALEVAKDRLHEKATERFEWGDTSGAGKVQDFAGSLPSEYDVKEAVA